MEFRDYKLLILPDNIIVDQNLSEKLANYLQDGGKIIVSYEGELQVTLHVFLIFSNNPYLQCF